MRKTVKKLALHRETLNNLSLKNAQGGMDGTANCTNLCTRGGCSFGCPGATDAGQCPTVDTCGLDCWG